MNRKQWDPLLSQQNIFAMAKITIGLQSGLFFELHMYREGKWKRNPAERQPQRPHFLYSMEIYNLPHVRIGGGNDILPLADVLDVWWADYQILLELVLRLSTLCAWWKWSCMTPTPPVLSSRVPLHCVTQFTRSSLIGCVTEVLSTVERRLVWCTGLSFWKSTKGRNPV